MPARSANLAKIRLFRAIGACYVSLRGEGQRVPGSSAASAFIRCGSVPRDRSVRRSEPAVPHQESRMILFLV